MGRARAGHRIGLQLAAVADDDLLGGLAARGAEPLDLLDHVHALGDLSEDAVLAWLGLGLGLGIGLGLGLGFGWAWG